MRNFISLIFKNDFISFNSLQHHYSVVSSGKVEEKLKVSEVR